jgi:hypothetical protein
MAFRAATEKPFSFMKESDASPESFESCWSDRSPGLRRLYTLCGWPAWQQPAAGLSCDPTQPSPGPAVSTVLINLLLLFY